MRIPIIVAALCVAFAGHANAQSIWVEATHNPRQLAEIERTTMSALFKGIPLSAKDDSTARRIVRETALARGTVDEGAADFRENVAALLQRRDAQLQSLLVSPEAHEAFDRNAKRAIFVLRVASAPRSPG